MKKIIIMFVFAFLLLACSVKKEKYINFSEASGICYMEKSDVFYVVSDEGKILKMNSKLEKIKEFKFNKNYDFEAIVCEQEKNNLLVVDENKGEIYKIKLKDNFDKLEISKKYKIKGYKLNKKGIEAFTKIGKNRYVITTQEKNDNLIFLERKDDFFVVDKKINFEYKDLSGLEFKNGNLYILSDKNDKIFLYDIEKNKIKKEIKLSPGAWEGISFDKNGTIFLADDNGRVVVK